MLVWVLSETDTKNGIKCAKDFKEVPVNEI